MPLPISDSLKNFAQQYNTQQQTQPAQNGGLTVSPTMSKWASSLPGMSPGSKFMNNIWNAVGSGLLNVAGGVAASVPLAADTLLGKFPVYQQYHDEIANSAYNPVSYFQKASDSLHTMADDLSPMKKFETNIQGAISHGNWLQAGEMLAYSLAENLPQYLFAGASVATGNPAAGLALMGTSAAGNKYQQVKGNSNMTQEQKIANALLTGFNEAAWEKYFSIPLLEDALKNPALKKQIQQGFMAGAKKVVGGFLQEGASEVGTQIAGNLIDRASNNRNAQGQLPGLFEGAVDAGLVGGIMGGGTSGLSLARDRVANGRQQVSNTVQPQQPTQTKQVQTQPVQQQAQQSAGQQVSNPAPKLKLPTMAQEDLYRKAVNVTKQVGAGSVAILQQNMKLTYDEATAMIARMQKEGIIDQRRQVIAKVQHQQSPAQPGTQPMPVQSEQPLPQPPADPGPPASATKPFNPDKGRERMSPLTKLQSGQQVIWNSPSKGPQLLSVNTVYSRTVSLTDPSGKVLNGIPFGSLSFPTEEDLKNGTVLPDDFYKTPLVEKGQEQITPMTKLAEGQKVVMTNPAKGDPQLVTVKKVSSRTVSLIDQDGKVLNGIPKAWITFPTEDAFAPKAPDPQQRPAQEVQPIAEISPEPISKEVQPQEQPQSDPNVPSWLTQDYIDSLLNSINPTSEEHTPTQIEPAPPTEETIPEKPSESIDEVTMQVETPEEKPIPVNSRKLRGVAEAMKGAIEAKRNPATANQNPTPRRANIIAGMAREADAMEMLQQKIFRVAEAAEADTLPESLQKMSQKTHFEQTEEILRRTKGNLKQATMYPSIHRDHLRSLLEWTKGKKGSVDARKTLERLTLSEHYSVGLTKQQTEALSKLLSLAKENQGDSSYKSLKESLAGYNRLKKMGIESDEQLQQFLTDYLTVTGEVKTKEADPIKEAERKLIGAKIPGYFPTPKTIVQKMIEAAEIEQGQKVLEPSAGKGNIADLLKDSGTSPEVIEVNTTLRDLLKAKGHNVVGTDFLQHTGEYDRIVMNPPFEQGQDIDHVRHAYDLLKPGGRLVAIMSEGPFFRQSKKDTSFREWLDEVGGTSEKLPEGSFKSSERSTSVATRMVIIEKDSPSVIKNAEEFRKAGVTSKKERETHCQQYAFENLMHSNGKGILHHGDVDGQKSNGKMGKVNHAWVEYGDVVYDPVYDAYFSKDFFYSELNPITRKTYTREQALEKIPAGKKLKESAPKGKETSVKTERGTKVNVQYALMEADELITSHDTSLNVVKKYPSELQPRDRSRAASEAQIQQIATNLEPDFLGANPKASDGAPIVGKDKVVESGNGRTIALKRLYDQQHKNAEKYRQWLSEHAEEFGISPDEIKSMNKPVLVRVNTSQDMDRVKFAREANESGVAAMSATERALQDAKKLTPKLLERFTPNEDGRIDTKYNRDFIQSFVDEVAGKADRATMLDKGGNLSQEGIKRITNAIFARAYGDPNTLTKLAESTSDDMKNITGAMLIVAPRMVSINEAIKRGEMFNLNIDQDLVEAVKKFDHIHAQGMELETFLKQDNLFGEKLDPVVEELMNVIEYNKRSRKKLVSLLQNYLNALEAVGNPNTERLFTVSEPTKLEILEAAKRKSEVSTDENQTSLFGETSGMGSEGNNEKNGTKRKSGKLADAGEYADRESLSLLPQPSAIELPELVELAKEINEGKYPRIVEHLKDALGQFNYKGKSGRIDLRADIFLGARIEVAEVKPAKLKETLEEFEEKYKDVPNIVIKYPYDRGKGKYEVSVYRKDPTVAAKVLAHEIGHLVDWLPDKDIKRGNILGRIASLKKHAKAIIDALPQAQLPPGSDFKLLPGTGQITQKVVKDELKKLSMAWKPFDPMEDPEYTSYRYSAVELYADAISVLLNEPELLTQKAPNFYKAFFAYLEKKPEVEQIYYEIQYRLTNRVAINEKRLDDIQEMFERDVEIRQRLYEEKQIQAEDMVDTAIRKLVDKDHGVLKHVRRLEKAGGHGKAVAQNARYQLEESKYISAEIENYLYEINGKLLRPLEESGLTVDDLGTYLFLKRVQTDREELANPLGHTKATAKETLAAFEKRLGTEKFAKLEKIVERYRDIREELIIPRVEEARMYSLDLLDLMKDSKDYAKFSVLHYLENRYGKSETARVYQQVGTLAEISNPLVSTALQDISMIRAAKLNEAKAAVLALIQQAAPESIQDAEMVYSQDRKALIAKEPVDPRLGMLTIMIDGKPHSFYVAKEVADVFAYRPFEATKVAQIWATVNQPLRDLLVSKNPFWMVRNVIRDFKTTVKNIPEVSLSKVPKLLSKYREAYKEAWKAVVAGEISSDIASMRKGYMLTSDRAYSGREKTFDNEIERLVEEFAIDFEAAPHAKGAVRKLYSFLDRMGRVSEIGGKIAGYKFLKEFSDRSEKEIGHVLRTRVGTPDYKRQGELQSITNNVFMFSNVGKEGLRSAWESYKDDPGAYIFKTFMFNVLPKLILLGALMAGPDELKQIIEGISEYDKRSYNVIPLGMTEKGKSVYLRIPQDYEGQFWGALFWNLAQGKILGMGGAIDTIGEQNPYSLNPLIQAGSDLYQYFVRGVNPQDDFRGRTVIPYYIFKEGGWPATREILQHEWKNLGGSIFYNPDGAWKYCDTTAEKLLQIFPFNVLGTFLKITDYGHIEKENAEKSKKK